VIFHFAPEAWGDLDRLYAFLAPINPGAADRAIDKILRAIRSLDHFPERTRPSALPGARELVVPFGQSNYIVRYVYDPALQEIEVLRIWHGREERS
jgi:plasmid stabilization system protein ParE